MSDEQAQQAEVPQEAPQAEVPPPAPAAAEEEVPMSCPYLKYKPNDFVKALEPYQDWVFRLEGMLFWRRPVPMAVLIVLVESLFIFIKKANLSTFAVVPLLITLASVIEIIYKQFGGQIIPLLFPAIDEGKEGESNRIYPLLPMCQRSSYMASLLYNKINEIKKSLKEPTMKTKLVATAVAAVLFLFFWVVGTFWFNFFLVNILIFVPGIVMHPKVFPICEPYILKFASSLGCPYCKPKFD